MNTMVKDEYCTSTLEGLYVYSAEGCVLYEHSVQPQVVKGT